MPQRIRNMTGAFNAHPFTGEGYSVYGTVGETVQYRNLRTLAGSRRGRRNGWIKGGGGNHDIAATSVLKTARLDSGAESPITVSIPADYASGDVAWDVRHFLDDVENGTDDFRTRLTTLDGDLDLVPTIRGTAQLLDYEQRPGGVVRLRFVYKSNRDGVQPTVMRAMRTAGPTSPADATTAFLAGRSTTRQARAIVTIDTPALSESAPYTYTIRAENTGGTVTKELLTGISVQADASGPSVPSAVTTSSS